MGNKNKKRQPKRRVYQWSILICMTVLFCFFLVVVGRNDKREISALADETLEFIEAICGRYDGYEAGNKAVSLKEVLDKTKGLTEWIVTKNLEDSDFLLGFVKELDLSGVLVTDEDGILVAQADTQGHDLYSVWQNFLINENKLDIIQHPNKTFCTQLNAYETDYYAVLVARQDEKGLVLGYKDTTPARTDLYETSIDKTLTNNTFHKNPRIVITDSSTVVASNNDFLKLGTDISSQPFSELGSKNWAQGKLIHLCMENGLWYGKRQVYGRYLIYVFYSASEVFTNILPVTAGFVACCALIIMIFVILKGRAEKKHVKKEREQLQTIKAITSLYVATSILHLKKRTFEGIESTSRAQQVLDETTDAVKVTQLLAQKIIAPNDQARYIEFLDFDTIEERLSNKDFLNGIFQDQNGIWFSTYLVPIEYDENGRLTDVLFASRNINDYKQKEEEYKEQLKKTAQDAKIANAGKTLFLRRMSHDIRTPINGIRGMTIVAKRSLNDPEKVGECLDKILYSSDYLRELLDNILRLSKLESGRMVFEDRSFDLKKLIERTTQFVGEQAAEKQISFSVDMSEITHTQVIASPIHLRQVMQNVLSNAIKFNRKGGQVQVICRELPGTEPEKMTFEFICSDTGIGMDASFQKDIFEPFAQEGDSARSNYLGAGLGLSIVKEILEQRGGKISFTSEKNAGTTFHITIPLRLDLTQTKSEPSKESDAGLFLLNGIRVLLVEDNEINMEIAKELLEQAKAVVVSAVDGKQALELFASSRENEFDVILMDIMMPNMDGLSATRAIRKLNRKDAVTVPIFAMTANAFIEDIQASKEAGMNEHFSKPLDMAQVIDTIARYCKMN